MCLDDERYSNSRVTKGGYETSQIMELSESPDTEVAGKRENVEAQHRAQRTRKVNGHVCNEPYGH